MRLKIPILLFMLFLLAVTACEQSDKKEVSEKRMKEVFEEVKTPFKYGVVLAAPDSSHMVDSPTVFRLEGKWYMTYIVFDGKGYETWLAESEDLLTWTTLGKTMPFTDATWDATQKAGYVSLVDTRWGGTYEPAQYDNRYWITYLGGSAEGYEAGQLGVGVASTTTLASAAEWNRDPVAVLSAGDPDVRWYDNKTIFKSSVISDPERLTGYPFVMYYNAAGDSLGSNDRTFESIAMAVSDDMMSWKRFGTDPVLTKGRGICGDAQIVKMDDLYVMFFFGHNWHEGDKGAYDRFACSYDLQNWTEWKGENLVEPTEPYDRHYAHKPWIIRWEGVVYHFYNAVGDRGRVIALATSRDLSL